MGEFVRIETGAADGVATLRLDRPKVNALNAQVVAELHEAANELAGRTDIRAVVIWGGPKVFAAGADINEFSGMDSAGGRDLSQRINDAFQALEQLPQITICAINGYALGGGCELAMAAEFRLVGESAVLGQPEILLGLIPGGGGTQRLSRLLGITKAKELIYSGAKREGRRSSSHRTGQRRPPRRPTLRRGREASRPLRRWPRGNHSGQKSHPRRLLPVPR